MVVAVCTCGGIVLVSPMRIVCMMFSQIGEGYTVCLVSQQATCAVLFMKVDSVARGLLKL